MNILSVYYLYSYSYSYYYENVFNSNVPILSPTFMTNETQNNLDSIFNNTNEPTISPSIKYINPTSSPTPQPTSSPTPQPTSHPSPDPTSSPTTYSTQGPTKYPTTSHIIYNDHSEHTSSSKRTFPSMGYSLVCFPLLTRFTISNIIYHFMCVFGIVLGEKLYVS